MDPARFLLPLALPVRLPVRGVGQASFHLLREQHLTRPVRTVAQASTLQIWVQGRTRHARIVLRANIPAQLGLYSRYPAQNAEPASILCQRGQYQSSTVFTVALASTL